jgi:hypothetical protein
MTALSGAFAQAGLQFFKRDKTVVHVAIARPHYLDLDTTAVQPGIRRIIEFINTNANSTRKKLVEALAPTPAAAPDAIAVPVAVPVAEAPVASEPIPASPESPAPAPAPVSAESAAAPAPPAAPAPTLEQQAVLSDLHWLIHQGHVIEFANGGLDTAKKPTPRPEPVPAAPRAPKIEKKDRAPKPRGRYVWDNVGLLPLPAPQPALVG